MKRHCLSLTAEYLCQKAALWRAAVQILIPIGGTQKMIETTDYKWAAAFRKRREKEESRQAWATCLGGVAQAERSPC